MQLFLSPIIIILIIFSLIIIISLLSYFECKSYKICNYNIINSKNDSKLKLLFISDFHNKDDLNFNQKLIDDISSINPDYILLGGDFINFSAFNKMKKKVKIENAINFINKLSKLHHNSFNNKCSNLKKIIFSFGNHELRLKEYDKDYDLYDIYNDFINTLKNLNIDLLDNSHMKLSDGILIYGLSLYKGYYNNIFSINKNFAHIDKLVVNNHLGDISDNDFNIIMFHKPYYAKDLVEYGFDLVLSGHNHGGLIKLPIIGALFSPDFEFLPKYNSGLYEINKKHLIVSDGIGEHLIKVRINNKPKVYVINIA